MRPGKWVCATMLVCSTAYATSTTNMVDQWGVASESGWGLSIQQHDGKRNTKR